jgi:nucleotide-binding universal stress UspA family protein
MRILFATDASAGATEAAKLLATLPLPAGTAIQAVTVGDRLSEWMIEWSHAVDGEWGSRVLKEAAEALARDGVTVTTAFRRGDPAREILCAAEEFDADLIAVGSEGSTGLPAYLLGGVARNVAHHAHVPVLAARAVARNLRRVILAIDESEHASAAAHFAAAFPMPAETEILVTQVIRPFQAKHPEQATDPEELERLEQHVRHDRRAAAGMSLGPIVASIKGRVAHVTPVVREGDPADEILELVREQQVDLIIAGARGVSLLEWLRVGSVADRLLKHAPCSVLLVR